MIRKRESARRNYGSFGPDEVWNLIYDTQYDKIDESTVEVKRSRSYEKEQPPPWQEFDDAQSDKFSRTAQPKARKHLGRRLHGS